MSDLEIQENPEPAVPEYRKAQRWNVVWAVPLLAILIGGWLLYRDISSRGAEVRIRFETADGIAAGKTEIRCRSVTVGRVTDVSLSDDLQSVLVECTMDNGTETLLRNGTRFWVVKPRVSAADISGLGTLLTGAYIELDPGAGEMGPRRFKGLEKPPATSRTVPGLRLTLVTDEAGSLSVGAPVYYRGFEVGRIEGRRLDTDGRRITYDAFIGEQYQMMVRRNSKFWNTSGIDVSAGADGFKVRTPSFQAMVSGGVSFALLEGVRPGATAVDGTVFELHEDMNSASSSTFEPTLQILLLFDQTVRGLKHDAPVEYRGIEIGRVRSISFDFVEDRANQKVPVLIDIDPKILRPAGADIPDEEELPLLADAVEKGLRATLKTGSLLTGAMFVDFNYYPEEESAELGYVGELPVVPTLVTGLAQIEVKLASIMDKIDALPLEKTMANISLVADEAAVTVVDAKATLQQIEEAAGAAKEVLQSPDFMNLPGDLRQALAALDKSVTSIGPDGSMQGDLLRTLDELRGAIRSIESASDTINDKPNSLLFGKKSSGSPKINAAGRR